MSENYGERAGGGLPNSTTNSGATGEVSGDEVRGSGGAPEGSEVNVNVKTGSEAGGQKDSDAAEGDAVKGGEAG